jgi:hypothetical protein
MAAAQVNQRFGLYQSKGLSRQGNEVDVTQPSLGPVFRDDLLSIDDLDTARAYQSVQPRSADHSGSIIRRGSGHRLASSSLPPMLRGMRWSIS